MEKLIFTLVLIFGSLSIGYFVQKQAKPRRRLNPTSLVTLRLRMQKFGLFVCVPLASMLSLWGLQHPDTHLLALPLLGVVSWISGGVLAIACAHLLRLDRKQTGSLFCCGTLSNIAGIGGVVCVFFFGEAAIALVMLYRVCEEIIFFGLVMPISQWYARERGIGRSFRPDPLLSIVILALIVGICFNYRGIPRPDYCAPLASGSMLFGTILLLVSIGMGLRFSHLSLYSRQWLAIAIIKFVAVPCIVISLAYFLGFGTIDNGLPLKAVAVVSAMPVAMNALVPPSLYGLDLDLANACWVFTTIALILIVPALLVITSAL